MASFVGTPISVRNLRKSFQNHLVLGGIDLDVAPGDLTVLIGASGCGKSTLLRCLNGLESFDLGVVKIGHLQIEKSETLTPKAKELADKTNQIRNQVGMVFQSFNLFPHLSLLENITRAPMIVRGLSQKQAESIGYELLEKVGLEKFSLHRPSQLSGGQQQRGAIARALAMSPKAMLYDEPTSALDPSLVDEVLQIMNRLNAEGMTQIIVTHEMRFAKTVGNHIVYMDDGLIVEQGPSKEIFSQPSDERTRKFLKNFL